MKIKIFHAFDHAGRTQPSWKTLEDEVNAFIIGVDVLNVAALQHGGAGVIVITYAELKIEGNQE